MLPIRDHNPSGRTPFVTYGLIALNVAIFLSYWPLFNDERALFQFYYDWALIPRMVVRQGSYDSLLTSMFLHGGWLHLAGNMLFLWIFGDNMEEEMGHVGYLLFYIASGVGAGLIQVLSAPGSVVPTVGASGAIAGVMGGYLLLFPKARVDVLIVLLFFIRIITIPAWIMLALWLAFQLVGGAVANPDEGGIAYWAHVGGFGVGIVLTIPLFMRRGGARYWLRTDGHPPNPPAENPFTRTRIPKVRRK